MRRSLLCLCVVLLAILSLTACGDKEPIGVNKVVSEMLAGEKVSHCYVVSLGDYHSFKVQLRTPQVSEEEYLKNFNSETETIGELTDEYVRNELGYSSIEEYRKEVDKSYLEHLKVMAIFDARSKINDYLLDIAVFHLDENDIAEFSKRMVYKEQNYSILFGYESFEEYLSEELQLTEKQFLQRCYEEAEREIKKCLLIGTVAELEKIVVPEGEDLNITYQELESEVYDLFMEVDSDF